MASLRASSSTSVKASSYFLTERLDLHEALSQKAQQNMQAAETVIQEALDELEALRLLPANWDSYGGEPPTAQAIISAENLLHGANMVLGQHVGKRLEPEYIAPRADGGIQIEWGNRPLKVSVQVTSMGGFAFLAVAWKNGVRAPREKHDVSSDGVIQEIARVALES